MNVPEGFDAFAPPNWEHPYWAAARRYAREQLDRLGISYDDDKLSGVAINVVHGAVYSGQMSLLLEWQAPEANINEDIWQAVLEYGRV